MPSKDDRQGPGDGIGDLPANAALNDVAVNPAMQSERNDGQSGSPDEPSKPLGDPKSGVRRRRRKPFVL